jgi:hypothetical protein
MRSSRTSNIKAKELAKKYTKNRNTKSQIVKAEPQVTQAGIVAPGPNAYNPPNAEGKKVSRDMLGDEIKRDADGEYDIVQVTGSSSDNTPAPKGISEQFIRGFVAPTEQFIQMPKDIIEGVKSEDQVMKDTGLDLIINPLIKPFATAQDRGVTDKKWYSPINFVTDDMARSLGLQDNNSLPTFLQNDGADKRDFVTGMSDNLGAAGDVLGNDSTYHGESSIGAGYEKSGERFMEAPAYYVGSALGEVPYFFIGVGQIKAAAKISIQAATYSAKTGKIVNPKLLATQYKVEQVAKKLQNAQNKENKMSLNNPEGKISSKNEILKAVDIIKSGYGVQLNLIRKTKIKKEAELKLTTDPVKKKQLDSIIGAAKQDIKTIEGASSKLDIYKKTINEIDKVKIPESRKLARIQLNALVEKDLLPKMRTFEKTTTLEVEKKLLNPKIQKLVDKGVDLNTAIKNKFNPRAYAWGDIAGPQREKHLAMWDKVEKRKQEGYYNTEARNVGSDGVMISPEDAVASLFPSELGKVTGVMGTLRYERDLLSGALDSAVNSKYSYIGKRRQQLQGIADTVSQMTVGLREFSSGEFTTIKQTVTNKRILLEQENKDLSTKASPTTQKLLKDKAVFEMEYQKKFNILEKNKVDLEDILETKTYRTNSGGFVGSRFIEADKAKLAETKSMLKGINKNIDDLKREMYTNKGYQQVKQKIKTTLDDDQSAVVSDINKNKKEIDYLKEIENNPMKNVWWTSNPKSINTKSQTYIFDVGALQKAVPSIGAAWSDTSILQAVRPTVSVQKVKGVITGQVESTTNVGKGKKAIEETGSLSGDPQGISFWVRNISKKDADLEFGKKYTAEGIEFETKTKFTWRNYKGRRYAVPKREKVVEKIEFYKPDDALQSAGQKHGVNAIYLIPRGASDVEKQLYKEKHYLEEYKGTDLPHMAFNRGDASTGNFVIYQEKKLPRAYVEGQKDPVQVRASSDLKQTERWLDVSDIVENRKIAQNRYDKNWLMTEQNSITKALESTSKEGISEAQYSTQMLQLGRRQDELTDKWNKIQESKKKWKEFGVKEVGDARGTIFSMPMSVLTKALKSEKDSLYSRQFIDQKSGKNYFRGDDGNVYEILDVKFDSSRVTNKKPKEFGEHVTDDSIKHTDRYLLGTSKPSQNPFGGSTVDMGSMTIAGQHIAPPENIVVGHNALGTPIYQKAYPTYAKKGEFNEKLYATAEEAELTRGVRGEWDPNSNFQLWKPGTIADTGGGMGRDGPLYKDRINLQIPSSYKNVLRKLDDTEESKLFKGTLLGEQIKGMEDSLTGVKQYSTNKSKDPVTGNKNVVTKANPVDGGTIEVAGRGYIWNNFNFGGGIIRHGVTNLNIKTRKKIIGTTKKLAHTLDGDRLQWVRTNQPGISDFQPLSASDRTMDIFEGRNLIIGFGQSGSPAESIRRMFATGDHPSVTQGSIRGGINVHSMYQFDSIFHFIKEEKIPILAKSEKANATQKSNLLKSQKLDTFDKMEKRAAELSSEKADTAKGIDGANKEFRETIVKLYYNKIKKTSLDKSEITNKAKDTSEFNKIKSDIKDNNLLRNVGKGVRGKKKKNQNIIRMDDIPDKFKANITYDDGSLITKGFFNNYFTRWIGYASKTRAKDMDITSPTSGKIGYVKDKISRKKDITVENVDPRTLTTYKEVLDELRLLQGGELDHIHRRVYNKIRGQVNTADEYELQKLEKLQRDTTTGKPGTLVGDVKKKDGTFERILNEPDVDDKAMKNMKPGEKVIWKEDPQLTLGNNIRTGPFKPFKKNINQLSDEDFKESIRSIVFEGAGISTTDKLDTSKHLAPSATQINQYKKFMNAAANQKKGGTGNLAKSLSGSVKSNFIGPPGSSPTMGAVIAAQQKINTASRSWSKVSEKASQRINPVPDDQITGAIAKGKQIQGQEPPSFMGGIQSMFMGSELPQAHAEENRLTSISNTVTSSFDGITKGGINIAINHQQKVKMSNSPSGGILGVNQNLIPQQSMKDSVSTGSATIPGFAMVLPTLSSTITGASSQIIPQTQEAVSLLSQTGISTTTASIYNQILSSKLREGSMLRSDLVQNPRVMPASFQRIMSAPLTPRVLPGPLPIIPLGVYGQPQPRRQQKRYKKKSGKAYWQTPQNWYEPYYWGGKDQMGSGYTVFKGKEPAKVKKYDQKWFGMDLGNLW